MRISIFRSFELRIFLKKLLNKKKVSTVTTVNDMWSFQLIENVSQRLLRSSQFHFNWGVTKTATHYYESHYKVGTSLKVMELSNEKRWSGNERITIEREYFIHTTKSIHLTENLNIYRSHSVRFVGIANTIHILSMHSIWYRLYRHFSYLSARYSQHPLAWFILQSIFLSLLFSTAVIAQCTTH